MQSPFSRGFHAGRIRHRAARPWRTVLTASVLGLALLFLILGAGGCACSRVRWLAVHRRFWPPWPRSEALRAFLLTLEITAIATVVNTVFGVAFAIVLVRHRFRGKWLADGLVDLPFAVSPVIAGLMLIVLYGPDGVIGQRIEPLGFRVVYALPGMVIACLFVTMPFVVREVVPLLAHELGDERGASRLHAGRGAVDHILAGDAPLGPVGSDVRRDLDGRPLRGRVRGSAGGLGQYPGPHPDRDLVCARHDRELSSRGRLRRQRGTGRILICSLDRDGSRAPTHSSTGRAKHRMSIIVKDLVKRFGSFHAVNGVDFEVPAGQLVALLGPSGSGKSTILRIIAGLESADSGEVQLTGEDATNLPAQQRGVGFVFQHYALFRHMTVRQNVAFGLEVQKLARAEVQKRVNELLDLVQMTGYKDRYPSQLSGGQRQRVALARALAPRPKVLLLDEPFGALDARVRDELRTWLRRLHDEVHVTSLFVTHDQQEAFEVADQVIVLNHGKVEQMGPPEELYIRPRTPFVTAFLGSVNVLRLPAATSGALHAVNGGQSRPEGTHGDGACSKPWCTFARTTSSWHASATVSRHGRDDVVRVTPSGALRCGSI